MRISRLDQIEHLAEFETRSDFDESEKATLRLAEIETRDPYFLR